MSNLYGASNNSLTNPDFVLKLSMVTFLVVQAIRQLVLVNAQELDAALPVFAQAVRLNPRAPEVHENFGRLLDALGRKREAFDELEKAADLRRATR